MTINEREICPSCGLPSIYRDRDYWWCKSCGDSNIERVDTLDYETDGGIEIIEMPDEDEETKKDINPDQEIKVWYVR